MAGDQILVTNGVYQTSGRVASEADVITNRVAVTKALMLPGVVVTWQSVRCLNYVLERGTDMGAQLLFLPLATNIVGRPATTTFMDLMPRVSGPFFYRVGVQE